MFSVFSTWLLFVFGFFLNSTIIGQQFRNENRELKTAILSQSKNPNKPLLAAAFSRQFKRTITLPKDNEEVKEFLRKKQKKPSRLPFKNIVYTDDHVFIYMLSDEFIHIREITHIIERQMEFLWWTGLSLLIFSLLSYIFWKKFTQIALKDLDELSEYVSSLDANNLDKDINLDHLPEGDKIKTVSQAISSMKKTIKEDIDRITRFVDNVSHEFKTPLMMISSSSQLSLKSWKLKEGLEKNIQEVRRLNLLLDSLTQLSMSKKTNNTAKEEHVLRTSIENIQKSIHEQYVNKWINYTQTIDQKETINSYWGDLDIILKNLLENAYKYTENWGKVKVIFDSSNNWTLTISNTWELIKETEISHLREAFRQADKSKETNTGFWLWLALVKELVEKNGRNISYTNDTQRNNFIITNIKK